MIYLLDSNVWIYLMRKKSIVLAARFTAMAPTADIRVRSVKGDSHALALPLFVSSDLWQQRWQGGY